MAEEKIEIEELLSLIEQEFFGLKLVDRIGCIHTIFNLCRFEYQFTDELIINLLDPVLNKTSCWKAKHLSMLVFGISRLIYFPLTHKIKILMKLEKDVLDIIDSSNTNDRAFFVYAYSRYPTPHSNIIVEKIIYGCNMREKSKLEVLFIIEGLAIQPIMNDSKIFKTINEIILE